MYDALSQVNAKHRDQTVKQLGTRLPRAIVCAAMRERASTITYTATNFGAIQLS